MTVDVVIVCPLEIERRAAARVVGGSARIVRTGPGSNAIEAALAALDVTPGGLVVLFGVAGGLRATARAPAVGSVLDGHTGQRWTPTTPGPNAGTPVTVVGVNHPVMTLDAKRDLARRAGPDAAIVDCESHTFARGCVARDARWAVVRGVSDGPDDTLPANAARWIDERGITRPGRVALDLLRQPFITPAVVRLGRATSCALDAASRRLVALLSEAHGTIPPDGARHTPPDDAFHD